MSPIRSKYSSISYYKISASRFMPQARRSIELLMFERSEYNSEIFTVLKR